LSTVKSYLVLNILGTILKLYLNTNGLEIPITIRRSFLNILPTMHPGFMVKRLFLARFRTPKGVSPFHAVHFQESTLSRWVHFFR